MNQWAQGTHTFLLRITGPALDRLSDAARRRLVALVLADPRSRTSRGRVVTRWPAPPDLLLYLLQRIPDTRRIELHTPTKQAIGLVSPEGRSVAVASMRVRRLGKGSARGSLQQPKRDRWWTETYGELDETSELDHILEEWQTLRRSGRTRLHIEARRSNTSTNAEVHLAWKPRGHS